MINTLSASACFEENLFIDANANRICVDNTGSLVCTSTCKTGHVYGDGTSSKTFTCSGENIWNEPTTSVNRFCLRELALHFLSFFCSC